MDTGHVQLSIASTPNTIAAPARSLFQTDTLASIYSFVLDPRGRPTAQLQPKEFQNALKFGKLGEQQEYRTRPRMGRRGPPG